MKFREDTKMRLIEEGTGAESDIENHSALKIKGKECLPEAGWMVVEKLETLVEENGHL